MSKVIKREELDRKFTEAVAKYMSKGMFIATQSMNGHRVDKAQYKVEIWGKASIIIG